MVEYRMSVKAELVLLYVDDDNTGGPWDGASEHPYENITSALEHAIDGDTILVRSGTYYENVVVNKSVSLIGEDRNSTIVDGGENGSVVSITIDNVSIEGFTIMRSGMGLYDSGIFVEHSSGNDISNNIMINNYNGISFYSSSGNAVSGNTIRNNYNGISFYSSSGNAVSGNTITSNNEGIYLAFHSASNIIYCNNFNNTHQVWSDSTNIWNDGSKGNYWSDYNGTDDDQDGIGETPYIINENNKDKYPLMGMFSDFRFIFNEETHHVNVISNSTIADFRFEIGQETGNKMISFNATGEGGSVGFCRVMIPIELMNYSYIVLVGMEKIFPTRLNGTSETYDYLYFTYIQNNHTITIISSETLYLYYELLDKYIRLETDLYDLNATYRELLNNYTDFLTNYSDSLINCSELQKSHQQLNNSYQEFLVDYSKKVNNIQNLMYILAATTAIFIITTIYLSRSAHAGKSKVFQEGRKKRTP
jgi:parallel beta-helix repeat protein